MYFAPTTAAPAPTKGANAPAPTKGANAPVTTAPAQLTGIEQLIADLKKRGDQARSDYCNYICKVNCIRLSSNDTEENEMREQICVNKVHSIATVIQYLEKMLIEPTEAPTMGSIPVRSFEEIKDEEAATLACGVCYKSPINTTLNQFEIGCPYTVKFPLRCSSSRDVLRMYVFCVREGDFSFFVPPTPASGG